MHGRELWRSDGTVADTVLVRDIKPGSGHPIPEVLGELNGVLLFSADDDVNGIELWSSDGTETGTELVRDIARHKPVGSMPTGMVDVNGIVFFTADDGTSGRELWKTDGSETGTLLVADVNPGQADALNLLFPGLAAVGGLAFYPANDGVHGRELWKSDGTPEGTQLVRDIAAGPRSALSGALRGVGSTVYFSASEPASGPELWKSDGSAEGTVLVREINLTQSSLGPLDLTPVRNELFFTAFEEATGRELWLTNSTKAGTALVHDINPGPASSREGGLGSLTIFGGDLFFAADDGVHGVELWRTDGTSSGTSIVKDVWPGINGGMLGDSGRIAVANGLLFLVAYVEETGAELWATDGTEAGTRLVKDIHPGPGGSYPESLTDVNGTLFFSAGDAETGSELWKSDGTEAGTVLVRDILPGSASSSPRFLSNVNGVVLFFADDGAHGTELWVSDGTEQGTAMVADIAPGIRSSLPATALMAAFPTILCDAVYFAADNVLNGAELWAVPVAQVSHFVGDCDHSGSVSVSELITGVNVALGSRSIDACPFFDRDRDQTVTIDELVTAVRTALTGCL